MVAFSLDDGVDGGERHVDGLIRLESFADIIDDALRHQRAHSVMKHEVDVASRVSSDGREARVVAFLATLENLLHLLPSVSEHDILDVGNIEGVGNDGNLLNVWILFEGVNGVFDDHFSGHFKKLLWGAEAQSATYAAGQDYGDVTAHIFCFAVLFFVNAPDAGVLIQLSFSVACEQR